MPPRPKRRQSHFMKTKNQAYDLIGDIHGHAEVLESLLNKIGYSPCAGVWRHPKGRQVIFPACLRAARRSF
jgi:hypothetical protein